jgi:hypothetical protein
MFISSDNPAFFHEAYGVAKPEAELVLPLSPSRCLHCSWQLIRGGDIGLMGADRATVREVNRRIVSGATRLVFADRKVSWLQAMLSRGSHYLSRINWADSLGPAVPELH